MDSSSESYTFWNGKYDSDPFSEDESPSYNDTKAMIKGFGAQVDLMRSGLTFFTGFSRVQRIFATICGIECRRSDPDVHCKGSLGTMEQSSECV